MRLVLVAVEAAAELSRLPARGEGSLLGALRGLALRTVTEEQCRALGLDEACFANINRRDDLDALST